MDGIKKELCVRLYRDNQILVRCGVDVIDSDGMYIDANPMLLPKGSNVDVVVSVHTPDGEIGCALQSVVTSRSMSGVGLSFLGASSDNYAALRGILMYLYEYKVVG